MTPILILILIVILIMIMIIWGTFGLLGLIFHLIIAGIVGWLADLIVPGRLPFGWLGAIAAGLVGSWLGRMIIGDVGPSISGIPLLPALLGAIILAFLVELIAKLTVSRRA